MPYKINGVQLLIEPTAGKWSPRDQFGIDGNGHSIYSSVRQFEINFGFLTPEQQNQLQGFFNSVITTGTAVVELPEYGASTYVFKSYSGCVLREPEQGQYFIENIAETTLLITNIST